MLKFEVAKALLETVNGNSFVGIDTRTEPKLTGGMKNPMKGRVMKVTTGANVMVFQNKNGSSYAAMVQRRLQKEGKDPKDFELKPRAWGVRLPDLPIVEHKGEYYLEVIFLNPGKTHYELDGKLIAEDQIEGLAEKPTPGGQGGLDNKVIIRTFKLSSITGMRIDGNSHKF